MNIKTKYVRIYIPNTQVTRDALIAYSVPEKVVNAILGTYQRGLINLPDNGDNTVALRPKRGEKFIPVKHGWWLPAAALERA